MTSLFTVTDEQLEQLPVTKYVATQASAVLAGRNRNSPENIYDIQDAFAHLLNGFAALESEVIALRSSAQSPQ